MSETLIYTLFVFLLAAFLGIEVIKKVSPLLHTPLMSLTNAISAISLVGSLMIVGRAETPLSLWLGVAAVICSTINVVGGFMITDRMLKMFKKREPAAANSLTLPVFLIGAVALNPGSVAATTFTQLSYLIASACFILSLKWMNHPLTARKGIVAGEFGMGLAVVGTIVALANEGAAPAQGYIFMAVGMAIGTIIGIPIALRTAMTAVPQITALTHAFGGLAVGLVGTAHYYLGIGGQHELGAKDMSFIGLEVLLGMVTFTGSLIAFGKLQEILPGRPMVFKGQNFFNAVLFLAAIVCIGALIYDPTLTVLYPIFALLSLLIGIMVVIPIGSADMPTVISLLNSYAGLAAASMGFKMGNPMLIIAGSLEGASGLILSIIMCKAMNRSFMNVMFGAFGQTTSASGVLEERTVRSAGPEEAASILEAAQEVVIVPGYGMAVAQAQHKVRELYDTLTKRGINVRFAIHPVAGRMPGHMNVLLAESDIPYDKLVEMEDINSEMGQVDVALIIGANDVVNPGARNDPQSPIYGMPIIDVDKAGTVMVIKRSMGVGFAGIDNELFFLDKTLMLFGDAKGFVGEICKELPAPDKAPALSH